MPKYSIGLDYGTNSCRSVIIDIDDGKELGTTVYDYPTGDLGILTDPSDPNVARQNPQDYIDGLEFVINGSLVEAKTNNPKFDSANVIGIGVDTTGSTPIPVDESGTPLALCSDFKDNLNAMVWLWKDHTAHAEAAEITSKAKELRPQYLAKCGGTYSSEWWWSKILHLKRIAPEVFEAAHSFVEHCDYVPSLLVGNTNPLTMKRSVCAAGHKAMYSEEWGGLPDKEFLEQLDPALSELRDRLFTEAVSSDNLAGNLCSEWAERTGLNEGVPVAVGAFDCHMGAVACGVKEGVLTKILGTSTCDIAVMPNSKVLDDIPGVCGIVDGSVLPNHYGIEAGQSAVGDIFLWLVNNLVYLVPDKAFKGLGQYALGKQKKVNDGIINPKGGIVMQGEQGTIQLNKNDSVIAGTNLFGGGKGDDKVVKLLERLIKAVEKGGDVVLDGQKVGDAMAVGSYRMQ